MAERRFTANEFYQFYDEMSDDLIAYFKILEKDIYSILDKSDTMSEVDIIAEISKKLG